MKKKKFTLLASAIVTFLLLQTSLTFAAPVYIASLSDFPAYTYNTPSYVQGGRYVGCGPTTGAMFFGYFEHHFSLTGLLENPVAGINEGLNTAWVLHSNYLNTQADGYGSVYDIKPGLEDYASDRGFEINVMAHAPTTEDPGTSWYNSYGAYGDAWMDDGFFWVDLGGGNWDIDPDLFCDFIDDKLASGTCIMLTADSDGDGSGDHWIPCVGVDSDSDLYYFYDTYSTTLKTATIDYCVSPGAGVYALSFVRSITLTVDNQPPVLNPISGPDTCYRGDTVTFHVAGNDPDGDYPWYYEWHINGNLMLEGEDEPTLTFLHTMDSWSVGENTVSVRVTDSRGANTQVSKTWTTLNHAPTVSAISGPASGYRGDTITVTATASDSEGDPLTYEWYIDSELFTDQTDETFTFTIINNPIVVGPHTIRVRVQDEIGDYSNWSSMTFTTLNHSPTVSALGPASGFRDEAYTFSATGSDAEDDTLTYEWYLDGTLASTGTSLTHTFGSSDALGEHTITVRVQDDIGDYSDNSTLTFTLYEARPIYHTFNVTYEEDVYVVETWSNSTVTDLSFNATLMKIGFNVDGITGTESFCNITIPTELLSGDFTVFIDDTQLEKGADYTVTSNSTHTTLSIDYTHSSHIINVFGTSAIPDFAGWLFLPFTMLATLLALAFKKKLEKQLKTV